MKILRLTMFVAVCAIIAGCATTRTNSEGIPPEPTTVIVENQALLDMTIYVLRDSQRIRLGTATGLGKTKFTLPRAIVFGSSVLRFQADPIGSNRSPVSEDITVQEGDEVVLRIPPN